MYATVDYIKDYVSRWHEYARADFHVVYCPLHGDVGASHFLGAARRLRTLHERKCRSDK